GEKGGRRGVAGFGGGDGDGAFEQRRRIEMPEQHERVGQRRLAAAAAVARGTRTSAGALRPDLEDVAELHRGNAAATGADGLDVDSVRPERMARDLYLRLEQL